jgi:hypothetical protein
MKKIAVFLGDFFWSSIPYDGIRLHQILSQKIDTDFLMFDKDIRLTKKFTGKEKFFFETSIFQNTKNLKTLSNWEDLKSVTKDYDLVLSSAHIAPKTRYPSPTSIKNYHCPFAVWDIGGADILTNSKFASIHFVKGPIWKKFLVDNGSQEKNVFVTGSPHYDPYNTELFGQKEKDNFFKKYQINDSRGFILVCPTNPASHTEQFNQNLVELEKLISLASKSNLKVLLKTYPGDYLFFEKQFEFSGVYKRTQGNQPQYEMLNSKFPELVVVESQDHFNAIMFCDALFNMSGSHIAWETHFSLAKSYSINYKNKKYYNTVSYLKNVTYPDDLYNTNINSIEEIMSFTKSSKEDNDYITRNDSCNNIAQLILSNTL